MKKFLTRKVGGFAMTLEILFCMVVWCIMMTSGVYIVKAQQTQKYMYNAFIQCAMSASKWGGSQTNLYTVNGRDWDLAANMQTQIRELTGQNVTISVSPKKVTTANSNITVTLTWTDFGATVSGDDSGVYNALRGLMGNRRHTLKVTMKSVVQPGKLL
jgi:hypothetical protein